MKKKLFTYLMIFMIFLICLLVGEGICQFYYFQKLSQERQIRTSIVELSKIPGVRYQYKSGYHERSPDYSIPLRINSLGLRGEEISLESKERILVLGDSIVEARYLSEEQTGVHVLKNELKKKYGEGNVEVINAGFTGRNTYEEYELLKYLYPRIQPTRLVLAICLNDFYEAKLEPGKLNPKEKLNTPTFALIQLFKDFSGNFASVRWFKRKLIKILKGPDAELRHVNNLYEMLRLADEKWEYWKKGLDQIRLFAEEHDLPIHFVLFPIEPQVYPIAELPELSRQYNDSTFQKITAYCKAHHLDLIDLLSLYRSHHNEFSQALFPYGDHLHPNALGQRLWAQALAKSI